MSYLRRGLDGILLLLAVSLLWGCATESDTARYNPLGAMAAELQGPASMSSYKLRNADELSVSFADVNQPIPTMTVRVSDDGTITLIHNQQFKAAGKTISQLQSDIHDRYVTNYYKYMTVTVAPVNQYYFVRGEVRAEGRQAYTGYMTVLGAVATTGGFNDFANRSKVQVTRAGGEKFEVDADKAQKDPKLNKEIFPNDIVYVPKRWL